MQKMDCQAIGYGYIIIPKALLKEQLIDCSPHEGEIEAFLKLLIKSQLLGNKAHRPSKTHHRVQKR